MRVIERGRKKGRVRERMIENDADKVTGREKERENRCIFSSKRISQGF